MNKTIFVIICAASLTATVAARGKSFLQAASFPKTFADVPLADRMAIKAEGYEDFDPVYENGVCVSGCMYPGIRLEEEEEYIRRNTERANAKLRQYLDAHPDVAAEYSAAVNGTPVTTAPTPASTPAAPTPVTDPTQNIANNIPPRPTTQATPPTPTSGGGTTIITIPAPDTTPPAVVRQCAQYSSVIRPGMDIVMQAPLDIDLVVTSDFGSRPSPCKGCSSTHRGLDFSASVGTNVYAPANGTVTVVKTDAKGCGKQIQIRHTDGHITQYCHLSQQNVSVGQQIQGGCLIGRTGNTGSSTGPHLHYALMDAPQSFIDPLWQVNMLGRQYRFKNTSSVSPEHGGKPLPGRVN